MEVIPTCTKCNIEFNHKLSKNDTLCDDCTLVVRTYISNDGKSLNETTREYFNAEGMLELPKRSVYFHLNKKYLEVSANPLFADKNVLIVGCNTIRRWPVLQNMKNLGFKRFIGLMNTNLWAHKFFDDLIEAEHENIELQEDTLAKVVSFMDKQSFKFDGILTFSCDSTQMTAYLQKHLNLPGIPYEIIKSVKNKYEFRKMCSTLGITVPGFFVIRAADRQAYLDALKKNANLDDTMVKSMDGNIAVRLPVIVKNPFGVLKGSYSF